MCEEKINELKKKIDSLEERTEKLEEKDDIEVIEIRNDVPHDQAKQEVEDIVMEWPEKTIYDSDISEKLVLPYGQVSEITDELESEGFFGVEEEKE